MTEIVSELIQFKPQFASFTVASWVEILKLVTFILLVCVVQINTNRIIKAIKGK